jgi:ribosomal protein S30
MKAVKNNRIKRDFVREEEQRIQEKLRRREEEKRKRNQLHYSMRVEDQKLAIGQIDNEISAMEREEREILDRLKNSQKLEQQAYKKLEQAIKTSVDCTEWRKQVMNDNRQKVVIMKPIKSNKAKSLSSSVYEQSIHS